MSVVTGQQYFPGERASLTAIGESESQIAASVARNFPEYQGQSVQESLAKWSSVIAGNMITVNNKPWLVPWRGYQKFSQEKKDRIIADVIARIRRNHEIRERGLVGREETWTIKGRERRVQSVRDERGRFLKGFPRVFLADITQPEII